MIFKSSYWKHELVRLAADLRRKKAQRRWTNASYAGLEKSVMLGFYAIRKLTEAFEPSRTVETNTRLRITSFPSVEQTFCECVWPDIDDHFDLGKPTTIDKALLFVCNQVIHSYVFTPSFRLGRLTGIFFCSDREKQSGLFFMKIEAVIELFESTAKTQRRGSIIRSAPEKNRYRSF